MKKHRLRELLKSLSGDHLGPDNSTSPEEDKTDVDQKVEKILKRLNEEEGHGSFGNSNEGPKLVALVNDFYKRYQSLYDRYDHLTGELRKRIHHTDKANEDSSTSSSSDSDSDSKPSSKDKKKADKKKKDEMYQAQQEQLRDMEIRNQKFENMAAELTQEKEVNLELQNQIRNLKESMDASNLEIRTITEEKDGLMSKNTDVLNKLQMVEKTVEELKGENSKLQVDYKGLKLDLETAKQLEAEMNHKLEALNKEKDDFGSENLKLLSKIQEGEKTIEDLQNEAEQLKEEKSKLWDERGGLKQELEVLNQERADLNHRLRATNEEKDALSLENSDVLSKMHKMMEEIGTELGLLKEENSKLQVQNNNLKRECEAVKSQRADLEEILTATRDEKNKLALENQAVLSRLEQAEKTIEEVKTEAERLKGDNSKLHISNENLNLLLEAVNQQVADLNQRLRTTNEEKDALALKNSDDSSKIQKMTEEFETEMRVLKEENSKLQVQNDDLKREWESDNSQMADLKEMLTATCNKNNMLAVESQELLSKLEEAEKTIEEANTKTEQLKGDNSNLNASNENMNLELESVNQKVTDLNQRVRAAEEMNSALVLENLLVLNRSQQAEKHIEELEKEIKCLREENLTLEKNQTESQNLISDLERRLKEGTDEVSNLRNKIKVVENEASGQVEGLRIQVNNQQLELDLLHTQKIEIEEQMKIKNDGASENQIRMEKLNYELTSRISDMQVLMKEKEENLDELRASYKQVDDRFQETCEKLQFAEKKIEEFEEESRSVTVQLNNVQLELELLRTQKTELEGLIEVKNNEASEKQIQIERLNHELICKISDFERMLEVAKYKSEDLQENYVQLHRQYHEASDKLLTAAEVMEMKEENHWIAEKLNDLKQKVNSLRNLNIESKIIEASENSIHMEKLNDLVSKIMQTTLKKQEYNLDWLCANYRKLDQFRELCENLHKSKKRIEEIAQESRRTIESKDETIQTIEAEKAEMAKEKDVLLRSAEHRNRVLQKTEEEQRAEIQKLRREVKSMEVQLILYPQRIRTTENELNDKAEKLKITESQLLDQQIQQRQLEQLFLSSSQKTSLLEDRLTEIKSATEVTMETLSNRLHLIIQKFEENNRHVQTRLSESSKDIRIAKTWAVRMVNEKRQMHHEICDLNVRLKDAEQQVSASQETIVALEVKLREKKGEKETAMRSLKEIEKKNGELEKRVKEKESEIKDREEEKREAIRQLCLSIEYHRENCNHLRELILTMMKRNR